MPFPPFHTPALVQRLAVPLLSLMFLPLPLTAGNKTGAGWQQAQPRQAKGKPRKAPAPVPPAPTAWPDAKNPLPPVPPAPAAGSKRTAPSEETIQRTIPGNGLLLEDDLIRLAIANNPELARRRADILIARARIRGAGDWENPELRIGYEWEDDSRLTEPFTERSTERIRSQERYSATESQRNLAPPFVNGNGNADLERSTGTARSTRYRTIERRVTPGRNRTVEETTVYENRRDTESFNRTTAETRQRTTLDVREAGAEARDRRIVERSREVISHPDDFERGEQLNVIVRFRLPHWWERKANIQLAAAETARVESDYLIEEDKIIRNVRALYEDLNMFESVSRGTGARRSMQEKFGTEVEAANVPELADLAADIRLEVGKSIRDQRELRSDIARLRQEIADYCGLDRPERIGVINRPVRRLVNIDSLDMEYLVSMAQLHRSDLLDLESRLAVAKAELLATKAAKIPFFTFVDAGWATTTSSGRSGEAEEWSVRAGITLPLFDWTGINKAHEEFRTATEAYSRQIEIQRQLISTQIRAAVDRIRAASRELGSYETDLARIRANASKSIEQTAVEPIKNLKTRYQNEDLVSQFEEDRYEVWSDYYKAVMELERALGTRLERVFRR